MVIRPVTALVCAAVVPLGLAVPALAQSPVAVPGSAGAHPVGSIFHWRVTPTGSQDEFRGLAAVSATVAWVSGETGTVLRTTDGGKTWDNVSPPAAKGLALRDIEAFGADRAVTLSIGKGKHSGVFATSDGGKTWTRTFTNHNGNAFFDCMAFSSDGSGLAVSDPVNGRFRLIASPDRGQTWRLLVPKRMPKALPNEFGFAASGTCLISGPGRQYWLASGGDHPRVFHTLDGGDTWTVANTPIRGGASAGIYSIAFHGANDGVIVGGDYTDPTDRKAAAATTTDGGLTWTLSHREVYGYRSGVAWVKGQRGLAVAVGPTGSDVSRSRGNYWANFDSQWYDGVECAQGGYGACWASGTNGRVAVLER